MSRPVRWYNLLSTWIFILSALYPIIKIPTFPLNILAVLGCYQCIHSPFKEHYLKNIYIFFIHLAPFFWIPFDLSANAFMIAGLFILTYMIFMYFINEDVFDVYARLLKEEHTTFSEFMKVRFGILIP